MPDDVVAIHVDLAVRLALDGDRLRHVPIARRTVLDRHVHASLDVHRHRTEEANKPTPQSGLCNTLDIAMALPTALPPRPPLTSPPPPSPSRGQRRCPASCSWDCPPSSIIIGDVPRHRDRAVRRTRRGAAARAAATWPDVNAAVVNRCSIYVSCRSPRARPRAVGGVVGIVAVIVVVIVVIAVVGRGARLTTASSSGAALSSSRPC